MATTVTWLPSVPASRQAPARRRAAWPGLRAMWQAATTRRLLADMDDRMLADIGISRADAAAEMDRHPWDTGLR